jgi:transposase
VGIEACSSAHHWSRRLQALGHTVRLMPPSYVKAYLKRSKNDANDAAAICEAVTRPSMRFVPTKSEQQQSGLMLHRSRELLVRQRTMLSNAIRGHMAELGIISAKGRNGTADLLQVITNAEDDRLPPVARFCLEMLARQYAALTAEIGAVDKRIHSWHRSCEQSRRLEEIPGIGPIVATALVAEIGDWKQFRSGRSLAAWIGLVPKQHSTGGKDRLAVSPSRAIATYDGSSSPVRWPSFAMLDSTAPSGSGSHGSWAADPQRSPPLLLPIRSPGWLGPSWFVARDTRSRRCRCQRDLNTPIGEGMTT